VAFWLLQGQRDRSADELEGLPLGAGRLGEHLDGDLGAGVPELVAGQGGQVLDQAAAGSTYSRRSRTARFSAARRSSRVQSRAAYSSDTNTTTAAACSP
jgi:hypothetical protein